MIAWLLDPFTFDFMLRALAVVVATGVASALLSCWIVHMGWSLMGDAVSHAVLPGVVIASIAGLPFAVGALAAALVAVVLIGGLREAGDVREDTAMGIVFTGLFSLGLVLITLFPSGQDLQGILFGNVLGIGDADLVQVLVVVAVVVTALLVLRRDLVLVAFDHRHARSLGLPVRALIGVLLVSLAAATVAGVQAVGVILVVATLVVPGATAQLLVDTMRGMAVVAVAVALVSGIGGLYLGYHVDLPPGPVIVLLQCLLFVAAQLGAPRRGLLARLRRPRRVDSLVP